MSPQGFGGANGMFALHTRLYMERYGAVREDFGRFCIALRQNALKNPNALFKEALTMDAYLNAKQIADPLRLYDCVMPCVGGDAIVLASERVAAQGSRGRSCASWPRPRSTIIRPTTSIACRADSRALPIVFMRRRASVPTPSASRRSMTTIR